MEDKKDTNTLDEEVILDDEGIAPEDASLEDIEGASTAKMKQLRQKLAACDEEKRSIHEELQRTRADFLNSKRRLEEQLQRDRERITDRHLEDLFPLADSFEMAMQAPSWSEADETWRKGIEGIYAKLIAIFKSNGIEVIDPPLGSPFNPHEHEAIIDNGTNDHIGHVLQKGYKRNNMVIRPAKVAVGKE